MHNGIHEKQVCIPCAVTITHVVYCADVEILSHNYGKLSETQIGML